MHGQAGALIGTEARLKVKDEAAASRLPVRATTARIAVAAACGSLVLTGVAVGAPSEKGRSQATTKTGAKGDRGRSAPHRRDAGRPGNAPGHSGAPGRAKSRRGSGGSAGALRAAGSNGQGEQRSSAGNITICHSTLSDTNPYVEITISRNALKAHQNHHDGADIIPAPAGGCPATALTPEQIAALPVAGLGGVAGENAAGGGETGAETGSRSGATQGGVAGVQSQGGEGAEAGLVAGAQAAEDARVAATAGDDEDGGSLPFTGLELAGLVLLGLALLGGGLALRRVSARRAAGGPTL